MWRRVYLSFTVVMRSGASTGVSRLSLVMTSVMSSTRLFSSRNEVSFFREAALAAVTRADAD